MSSHNETYDRMLRHAQMLAMGNILVLVLAEQLRRSDDPAGEAARLRFLVDKSAEAMTFPDVSPEWSDLAAQELRDSSVRIVERARALALEEPFDPERFRDPSRT